MLADRVGAPPSVPGLLAHLTERWDGHGPLRRAKGGQIPVPMRIVHVATDAAFQRLLGGAEHAARLVRERAGHAFDPQVAACLVDEAAEILALEESASAWDEALALEPAAPLVLETDALERALSAMANFADLISPYLAGHSAGVAELAAAAAPLCRIDALGVTAIRRAALLHDLGRVAIHARIWQKPGPLTPDEWEQVRLHPYHTERVLSRSPFLSALSPIAEAHHERLDGSGYHRRATGPELGVPARLLAAADTYHAMNEPRPHREPHPPERAAQILAEEASAGRLDPDAVTAVLEAVGPASPAARASGGAHRARGRGGRHARARPADQAGRASARNLGQDRRPPYPERLPQDRRILPCRRNPVRHGARAVWHGENYRLPGRGHAPSRTLLSG